MNHPLTNYNFRRKYEEIKVKRLKKHEKIVYDTIVKYLRGQKDRVLEAMGQKSSQFFNKEEETKIAKSIIFPALERVMREEGEEVSSRFGINFVLTSQLESTLNERAEFFTESINNTTFEQLKSRIQEGIELGENYEQIGARVDDLYGQTIEGRGRTIARTETHYAQQTANLEGYKQGGLETKVWVAAMQNTRDSHISMDGQEVPINSPFTSGLGNRLMFPGDGPPADSVNCQCQV
jgi:hypothetical protein